MRGLGPAGPFPDIALSDGLERRWLHYAFLSRDGRYSMVANTASLGPPDKDPEKIARTTTILLLHERGKPWVSSQFNAATSQPLWSAFRQPHVHGVATPLSIGAISGAPRVDLSLMRTSRPCTSQCAPFANNHHLRWQSETGVRATGQWQLSGRPLEVEAVGYHERVRGRWGWPELDEWVFGFANDLHAEGETPPAYAGVFTFIKPVGPEDATTASFMLWHQGRLRRHFPRRNVTFAVRGILDRDCVTQTPPLSRLFGVSPLSPVPKRLVISARQGDDWVILDFESESAARVVIPSETSLAPFSVHEVVGPCILAGRLDGERFEIKTRGIVGTPLLEINTKFLKAVTYGETITIATHIEEWRTKVFVQLHRVTRGDELVCEGREVRAFVRRDADDPDRLRAIPVPDDIKAMCS